MLEKRFCAFIDVLGYGALVSDNSIGDGKKIRTLNSIYVNLVVQISNIIRELNSFNDDKIFIRSFSDSIYLDCAVLEPIIYALNDIFNNAFGFYANMQPDEERTPLLRCGLVYEWVVKFRDIGGITNNTLEENPVGLGVARAYWTSEKSKLSGMRIILSKEVVDVLPKVEVMGRIFKIDVPVFKTSIPIFLKHIPTNEDNKNIDCFELIWTYHLNGPRYEFIDELIKLKPTFETKQLRHFIATAEIIKNGLMLYDATKWNREILEENISKLDKAIANAKTENNE